MAQAPEVPVSLDWLNTDRPPSLAGLRGKVVLLFFWCYSNTQSIRLLPALRQVAQDHDPGVVVLGIHCPKFAHERAGANVRKALNRNFVRFPVASDPEFETWRRYGIEAWPSVAVVSADGNLHQVLRGDDTGGKLDRIVGELIVEASNANILDASRVMPVRGGEAAGFLRFPTAVLEARGLLYVSDAANNRIVELSREGRVQRIFGSGNPGFWDGVAQNCGFNVPRGLAYAENFLYVADTANHAIRRINLFSGEVETVLGNGKPDFKMTNATRRMLDMGLPLPVGLAFQGPDLFVSVSGIGQLWRLDLAQGTVGWFSGTGQHGVVDGDPVQAAFAQPLGLAAGRTFLYVADGDGSAVREVRSQTGHVRTRCGQNPFVFGFEDGLPATALVQYPMDVALRERGTELWIADSFNNQLRVLDLKTSELSTPRIEYAFSEPAGISITGSSLWVANTNAHEIVHVDLISRRAEALTIEGIR